MISQTVTVERIEEEEEHEEQREEGQHCTNVCKYAHKIKCVCGCGGKNHGIKSMIKMDAFFGVEGVLE